MQLVFHPSLTEEKWRAMGLTKQLLNIISELTRFHHAQLQNDETVALHSLERSFELIDLTAETNKQRHFLKELLRFREELGAYYVQPLQNVDAFRLLMAMFISLDSTLEKMGVEF